MGLAGDAHLVGREEIRHVTRPAPVVCRAGDARLKRARNAAVERTARAVRQMADVAPIAATMHAEGGTLGRIAAHLNAEGYVTRKGKSWRPEQVRRVLDRLKPAT
jgi:hypothetical protein